MMTFVAEEIQTPNILEPPQQSTVVGSHSIPPLPHNKAVMNLQFGALIAPLKGAASFKTKGVIINVYSKYELLACSSCN